MANVFRIAPILALALLFPASANQVVVSPAGPGMTAVVSVSHDQRGHTMFTRADGTSSDIGIPNTRGNISYQDLATGATVAIPQGMQVTRFLCSGSVTQTVQLPASPQDGDQTAVSTGPGCTISALTALNGAGATVASGIKLLPMTQFTMLFDVGAGGWIARTMPATLYGDAQAAAAAPVQSVAGRTGAITLAPSDIPGVATSAQISSAISGLNLGSSAQHPASDFYSASNPSGYISAIPPATQNAIGGVTLAQIPAAYTLPAATATTLGGIKSGLTLLNRTTSPVSVPIGGISVLAAGILPSVTVTVPGVVAGDFVLASYAGTPPTNITISGVQATAANTVLVTPAATAALSVGAQNLSLNFVWMR